MRLPNGDQAVIPREKLADYCLSPEHPRGQHKARVFATVLGITVAELDLLTAALMHAAVTGDAVVGQADEYGQRFVINFEMEGPAGTAIVRSLWIVRSGESTPRLTSCFVV